MHVRFSTVVGLPVVEESSEQEIAAISGILIHPDQGKIEGFFVSVPGFFQSNQLFLSVFDITHWGSRVRVRESDVLFPVEDLVRLQSLLEDNRSVINQKIITEDSVPLGTCRDVQFDTTSFMLEWLFPRKFWRWGIPVPVTSVVQVRSDAIVVRNAVTIPEMATGPSVLSTIDPLGTSTATPRVMQKE